MVVISRVPEWNECFNLLLDPSVSEVESNGPNSFFIKKSGKRMRIPNLPLLSEDNYFEGIAKGLIPFVKSQNKFDKNSFIFEGRLEFSAEGTDVKGRCHIVLPPAADYPQVTIAKKTASLLSLEAIASAGSMSTEMFNFLQVCIAARKTIVLSGRTGAGKTTMLEALAKNIPNYDRIGVAEDTPELVLPQSNVTYLHSTPWSPGMSVNDVATLDWVVAQFMRNRCDRMIIGETRGKEFAGFLTAANSGMEGGLTTIHAEDPRSSLRKMANFTMEARSNVPMRSVNTDIANAIDIIVQLVIVPGGKHRISHIEEIVPTLGAGEDAPITTQTLYEHDPVKDLFFKRGLMGDSLRRSLIDNGQNIDQFLKMDDKRVPAHMQSFGNHQQVNPGSRTLPTGLPKFNDRRNL